MSDSNVLEIGTEVSAKYRGAFCEATIKNVKKLVKVRVMWNKPLTGSATLTQDQIRGEVKLHKQIEARNNSENGNYCNGTVIKITDASTYTVVFDDGDERTLGRNSVCPQGAKHFNEEWTLDHLPLTNPENFGTPVILDSKKQRKRRKVDSPTCGRNTHYSEEDVGKVAFYDTRGKKQTLQPVLISSHSECDEFISTNPGEVIVRSFRSGKFMSIPKEDMLRFDRGTEPLQSILNNTSDINVAKPALEKALAFYDTGVLPLSWESSADTHVRLKDPENLNNVKLQKEFTAALHEFWDKKGTPITRTPSVGYHDLDLYALYCYVTEYGGPDNVTKDMKWRSICAQMNILNLPPSGSHTVKSAYCRHVVPFADQWLNRGKRKRVTPPRAEVPATQDVPTSSKKRCSTRTGTPTPTRTGTPTPTRTSTPTPTRTGTPTPGKCGRRNSVKLEQTETDSVSSDLTDYENMPAVHKYNMGQRVKVVYGAPKHCGSYEAKVVDRNIDARTEASIYYIHYTGWNVRYDEWITEESILSLVTRSTKKAKGTLLDPPKELKVVPNKRKIVPKYKRYKKHRSATSETSSDDKNSLPASECSDVEGISENKPEEEGLDPGICIKQEAEVSSTGDPPSPLLLQPKEERLTPLPEVERLTPLPEVRLTPLPEVKDEPIEQPNSPRLHLEAISHDQNSSVTTSSDTELKSCDPADQMSGSSDKDTASTSHDNTSPLICKENINDMIDNSVSSSNQPVIIPKIDEDEAAKEEAAAILMTFPNTFAMKTPLPSTVPSANTVQYFATYPTNKFPTRAVLPTSPIKHIYTCPTSTTPYITTTGSPTQYLTTHTTRPPVNPATLAKLPLSVSKPTRIISKSGTVIVVNEPAQTNLGTIIKGDAESNEKKKGRKRKIQQADSTSDIGSRLQQFEFRPDPCEDCDKRADERPKRTERDKARRGTVKNSDIKISSGERPQQPPYWIAGSVVGSNYIRSSGSNVPLYYSGSDLIQGGYYVPMRPPGIGPYPPGYTPKFPIPNVTKSQGDVMKSSDIDKTCEMPSSSTSDYRQSEVSSTTVDIQLPDSTVSDHDRSDDRSQYTGHDRSPHSSNLSPAISRDDKSPPHSLKSPPYPKDSLSTPPHLPFAKNNKSNLDSDSSDEKATIPGMSPLILTQSLSECSDKEQPTSSKVKIFDKDFGIHLFDHLDLGNKIKSMQSTMSELQKWYQYFKSEVTTIDKNKKEREKREREKRKGKKRKQRKERNSNSTSCSQGNCGNRGNTTSTTTTSTKETEKSS